MKRRLLLSCLAGPALAAALAACAATGGADPSAPVDAAAVYRARCALCHPAWSPKAFPASDWPKYVGKYASRAGLTRAERDAVLAYLVTEAGTR